MSHEKQKGLIRAGTQREMRQECHLHLILSARRLNMRFFSPSAAGADPRSSSSSSSASVIAEEPQPFTSPPPPTRMNTAYQLPPSRLPLPPAASPEKASTLSPGQEPDEPLDSRRYTSLPKTLHAELEEYDARASRAEPIHYFSDNQHAQYVCRECMTPLVSTLSA